MIYDACIIQANPYERSADSFYPYYYWQKAFDFFLPEDRKERRFLLCVTNATNGMPINEYYFAPLGDFSVKKPRKPRQRSSQYKRLSRNTWYCARQGGDVRTNFR